MRKNRNRGPLDLTQHGITHGFFIACYSSSSKALIPEPNEGFVLQGIDRGGWIFGGRSRVHVAIRPYVLQSTSASQQSSLRAGINSEINLRNALDTDTNVISQDGA